MADPIPPPPGFFRVSGDRYVLRYLVSFTQAQPGPFTRAHATLLADMVDGPLKDLWNVSGLLSDAAARTLFLYDPRSRVETEITTLSGPVFASAVPVIDVDGAPDLRITLAGGPHSDLVALVTLEYRHSTGR